MRRIIALALVISALVFGTALMGGGCGKDRKAIAEVGAKLDLARGKSDLDGMYLALKTLQGLGVDDQQHAEELEMVESALPIQETMVALLAEHDHERALWSADELLAAFPNHAKARSTALESGKVMQLYAQSARSVASCFEMGSGGVAVFKSQENGEIDSGIVARSLREASQHLSELESLDPHFPEIKNSMKDLHSARDALCISLAIDVFTGTNDALELADGVGVYVYNEVAKAGSSASFIMRAMRSSCQESLGEVDSLLSNQQPKVASLREFGTSTTSRLVSVIEEFVTRAPGYASQLLLTPGSISGWSNAIDNARAKIGDHKQQILMQLPDAEQVAHDIAAMTQLIEEPIQLQDSEKTLHLLNRYMGFRDDVSME